MSALDDFETELAKLVNFYSLENGPDMPDVAIAAYLRRAYESLCVASETKVNWTPECVRDVLGDMQNPEADPSCESDNLAAEALILAKGSFFYPPELNGECIAWDDMSDAQKASIYEASWKTLRRKAFLAKYPFDGTWHHLPEGCICTKDGREVMDPDCAREITKRLRREGISE